MKVTQTGIRPSEASTGAGRPALTPELLAASGARYSRNNDGLDSILSKIDPNNLERSVDSIFRMVDYGHQSIADMVPVAMFIDGISSWLAYYLWTLCPTAGGQESSTRYIRMSVEGLIPSQELGISAKDESEWRHLMAKCFYAYETSLKIWEEFALEDPAVTGIPPSLLNDKSDSAQRKVQRMKRNYAFDRARYFLPVGASTNVMMIMSARGWVSLCQQLLSHSLIECRSLGELLRSELELAAPRMIKHATATPFHQKALDLEFQKLVRGSKVGPWVNCCAEGASGVPFLSVVLPEGISEADLVQDFANHCNRYAPFGSGIQRTSVSFGWSAIGFAEIRDLNRHRTGTKYCPQVPMGFYCALDQISSKSNCIEQKVESLSRLAEIGQMVSQKARSLLNNGDPTYIYWTILGTEYPFEHTTTADKFIYEAELRTGLGAHYRYAKHLRDLLTLWYNRFPATKGLVLEGAAEPE